MGQAEPPSSGTPLFYIGRNSHGQWVVQDQRHLCGGLFVDRAKALKFALFENGHKPNAVIMVPGVLELDMAAKPGNTNAPAVEREVPRHRQAA
jgi:hypothetical protein